MQEKSASGHSRVGNHTFTVNVIGFHVEFRLAIAAFVAAAPDH